MATQVQHRFHWHWMKLFEAARYSLAILSQLQVLGQVSLGVPPLLDGDEDEDEDEDEPPYFSPKNIQHREKK